jgi:hypothetical protein
MLDQMTNNTNQSYQSDNDEYNQLQLEHDHVTLYLKQVETETNNLKRSHREWENEFDELISDIKTRLDPEMKQYHKSKVSISKRGGAGAKACNTYFKSRNAVKDIIDANYTFVEKGKGATVTEQQTVPRNSYKENVQVEGINVQFRIKTRLGRTVNVVVQTQSQSGGAYKKFAYSLESMKNRPDEICVVLFNSKLNVVQSDVAYIRNINDDVLNVKVLYDLESFEDYLMNI